MRKCLSFFLCLLLILGSVPALPAYADTEWPAASPISADSGIVIDADSGAVLYGKNMQESYFPASITKILTALLIIENCDLDDMVTFTHSAVNTLEYNSTILGARVGDKLSVRDCLYALLLQSANEVANALAEHCSGSIEAFAELMNRRAESLGCLNTHFTNPSGLNDDDHYTSAYDMALIARAAFSNPTFVEIDATTYYDVQPGQLQQYPDGWRYYTHHRMLKQSDSAYYNGIVGGKTGYTMLAGNTLVTCAERDGLRLIAVVLNGHQTHYEDTRAMLDFGFDNFKSVSIAERDSTYEEVENDLSVAGIFPGTATRLSINEDSVITLPLSGDFADVTSELTYSLNSSAPENAVARIDYMYGDHKVGEAYLEASVVNGYIPGLSEDLVPAVSSGVTATLAVPGGQTAGAELSAGEAPQEPQEESDPAAAFLTILLRVISVIVIIGIVGAVVFGFLIYRERKVERERMQRRKKREARMKEWGDSPSEFDLVMQEHLRKKNRSRRRGFR